MSRISRSPVLIIVAILVLLALLPRAVHRLVQTGDLYLFSERFFADMFARLSGPGRFRFILQPVMAILLGTRDGMKDAQTHSVPFLLGLMFHREHRLNLLRSALVSVCNLVAIAILLDIISQFLIFREIHPGAALLLGPALIGVPYALARAFANRITRWRKRDPTPATRAG
jgi:hypothetical protein